MIPERIAVTSFGDPSYTLHWPMRALQYCAGGAKLIACRVQSRHHDLVKTESEPCPNERCSRPPCASGPRLCMKSVRSYMDGVLRSG